MRFYSFTNIHTSGIHAGIQSAHAIHEMILKYIHDPIGVGSRLVLDSWMQDHKTLIVKAGGFHGDLEDLYLDLLPLAMNLSLPIIKWRESEHALNGATTAIGIVVPASVYDWKPNDNPSSLSFASLLPPPMSDEEKLNQIINSYRLAI